MLLLHILGIKCNEIQNLDWWQFYGYQKILDELLKIYYLFEGHIKRITRLLFIITCSPYVAGNTQKIEEFFDFEEKIANAGTEKEGEAKEVDPLEGEGEWEVQPDGSKQWIYNRKGITNLTNFLDRFKGRRRI